MAQKNSIEYTATDYEALDLLQEECAEVIQMVSKIRRFGTDSYHPGDPAKRTNIQLLEDELGDVALIQDILVKRNIVSKPNILERMKYKIKKLSVYTNLFKGNDNG